MTAINRLLQEIQQQQDLILNPFSDLTYGNFWFEKQQFADVDSIHEEAIAKIEKQLKLLKQDPLGLTKSILITGDSGSGKSNLLGRLKNKFKNQASFVYIQPLEDYSYFWRHTLQYTVSGLMAVPEGETDSQLRLWLKSLPIFRGNNLSQRILGEKRSFIRNLKSSYPVGIYEARKFFGILYELANDENYDLACEWLAGEDLDTEELKTLGIKNSINSERVAKGILTNFGRIADATNPIILCFDQIERAFSSVFNFNTTLHNERVVNFLVLISATRENWQDYKQSMIQSDLARINETILLDDITIDQAIELWSSRLQPLHSQCDGSPDSTIAIAPLKRETLAEYAPGGRINLRVALTVAGEEFAKYVDNLELQPDTGDEKPQPQPQQDFITLWKQTYQKIADIGDTKCSDPEFVEMLKCAFRLLGVNNVNPQMLRNNSNSNKSFSYTSSTGLKKALICNNTKNGNTFSSLMKIIEKIVDQQYCQGIFFIRTTNISSTWIVGCDIYKTIFKPLSKTNIRLKQNIEDIYLLRTCFELDKKSCSGDLYLNYQQISHQQLAELIDEFKVLSNSSLLTKLGVVSPSPTKEELLEKIELILANNGSLPINQLHQEINQIYSQRFIPKYYFRDVTKNYYQ